MKKTLNNSYQWLEAAIFENRTKASLGWLKRSFQVTAHQGSSAHFRKSPFAKGKWSAAYPETTGYIIETLFDYYDLFGDLELQKLAFGSADWLISLQMKEGSFQGGFLNTSQSKPSIFNTGQIIFGLIKAYERTNNEKYFCAFRKAVNWLISVLEKDHSWKVAAYKQGFIPSYYTRVVWALLYSNQLLKDPKIESAMREALSYYLNKLTPQMSIRHWSFDKEEMAYTHTIAYTIRGILESSLLLKDDSILQKSIMIANKIVNLYQQKGKLAGRYDENWEGDYSFQCLTGNAQLSIIFAKLFQLTNNQVYKKTAISIFQPLIKSQYQSNNPDLQGAIPGSKPFWGAYFRFAYPNWGAKFFLDGYKLLYEISNSNEKGNII